MPEGLAIDTELRWSLLQALVAAGAAGPTEIEAELDSDRTASGERAAALARALVPTAESKAEVWRRLTGDEKLPNWLQRSLLQGFQHSSQLELTAPYAPEVLRGGRRDLGHPGQRAGAGVRVVRLPALAGQRGDGRRHRRLAGREGHPAPLRRLVAEGRDGIVRALTARAKDATAA